MNKTEILADSTGWHGHRAVTYKVSFPQIVAKEVLRHRVFSFLAASQRAIPFEKNLLKTKENTFIPIAWQKAHKGMQGSEYFSKEDSGVLDKIWEKAARSMFDIASELNEYKATKQLSNRLLEQFQYVDMLVSGTEYDNFFKLRNHEAAEIHIADLAELMQEGYKRNKPDYLQPGDWHIPYNSNFPENTELFDKIKSSAGRCARLSYNTFDGKQSIAEDVRLYSDLIENEPVHASPTEFPLRCMSEKEYYAFKKTVSISEKYYDSYSQKWQEGRHYDRLGVTEDFGQKIYILCEYGWCRNYRGFRPLRDILGLK